MLVGVGGGIALIGVVSDLTLRVYAVVDKFVVPGVVLSCFNSSAGNLVSSLGRFLDCVSLLRNKIANIMTTGLCGPLIGNSGRGLSTIIIASGGFFGGIKTVFVTCAFYLTVMCPLIFGVSF